MYKLAEDSYFDKRKQDLQYADYYLKHKYNMADAGVKLHLPLSTIVKHDISKLKPSIWAPHRDYFYSSTGIAGTNDRETYLRYMNSRKIHSGLESHHSLNKTLADELESVADWYSVGKSKAQIIGEPFPTFKGWWLLNRNRLAHQLSDEAVNQVNLLASQDKNVFDYVGL